MTTTLRARFDGKVLIPEGPVDLPVNQVLELRIDATPSDGPSNLKELAEFVESFPQTDGPVRDGAAQHDHYLYGAPKRP